MEGPPGSNGTDGSDVSYLWMHVPDDAVHDDDVQGDPGDPGLQGDKGDQGDAGQTGKPVSV